MYITFYVQSMSEFGVTDWLVGKKHIDHGDVQTKQSKNLIL